VHVARPSGGIAHARVHDPQWAGSLVTSTHDVPHNVLVEPEQPVAHP
jgi:hypothetical protein